MLDYPIVVSQPDISRDRFIHLLALAGSPAAPVGWVLWDALARKGISPLFFLAMFNHESRMGLAGIVFEWRTHSPGNVRSIQNPEHGGVVVSVPGRGNFVRYPSWEAGTLDWCDRLLGPKYAGDGLTTVRQVIPKWAPASDGNVPTAYIASVLGFIARHREAEPEVGMVIHDALTPINHWTGRDGHTIRAIVLHITDGDTAASAIGWFRNPDSEVSAHYVIDRDGTIYRVVAEADTAWTNGWDFDLGIDAYRPNLVIPVVKRWIDLGINPNKETVSIEAAGKPATGWTAAQVTSARRLVADIAARHGLEVSPYRVIGHMDIDSVNRARCPSLSIDQWAAIRMGGQTPSTDPLLDAEYDRLGGAAVLGAKVVKARLDWTVDWGGINSDVLIAERGVVSVAPPQTETAQRMFTDKAREALEAAGVLRVY